MTFMDGGGRNSLYLLSLLQRMTRGWFMSKIAPLDVTVPMFSVLFEIDQGPQDVTSSELARRSYVSVQTVNLVVQGLAERGLVDRTRIGQGRQLALTLTPAGRKLLAALSTAQLEVIDGMTRYSGVSSPHLRDTLTRLVRSVERSMSEETERGSSTMGEGSTIDLDSEVRVGESKPILSGTPIPALSFGSWHIYSRMHFSAVCEQVDQVIASGQAFFDIGNYDGMTPRGDSIAHSDIVFGRALAAIGADRSDYLVQTKVWLIDFPKTSLDAQLDTLSLRTGIEYFDYINVGMFQMVDDLPLALLLEQIDTLYRKGRIGGWGVTGWSAGVLGSAHDEALERQMVLPTLVQLKYGPSRRAVAEGAPFDELFTRTKVRLQTSDTLEGGVLLGKEPDRPIGSDLGGVRSRITATVPRFLEVAAEFGVPPATLGYAFALTHPYTVNALVGARGAVQVREALAAAELAKSSGTEVRSALEFMYADQGAVDVSAWS